MEDDGRAGDGEVERVSRRLRAVDLKLLTGQADLLRSVAGFDRRTNPFTSMLAQEERRTPLLQGVMGLDARRRGLLGTAIGASAVTKGLRLDRQRFVQYSTLSLGSLASAQLSTPALQALTRPEFALPEGVLGDRKKLAAYGGLGNQFHQAIAQGALVKPGTGTPMQGFGEAIRRILSGVAGGAWRAVELRHEIDEDAIVFVERHGWPLPLALPRRIVHRVARMAVRGKRDVQRFMCESFAPRTSAYRVSRDRLLESHHFGSRRRPIEQALRALNRGDYYPAICTLLPLVEGVLVDVILAEDPPDRVAHKAFAEMQEIGDEVDAVIVQSVETLVVSATSGAALFSQFDRRDYGGTGESRRLNRHAILHGSARRYGTHANALKLFLLLVALAEVLDIYEEERSAVTEVEAEAA